MSLKWWGALIVCAGAQAQAQADTGNNSVTLFGVMDAGITYVSNEGGHGNAKFDDGILSPNMFGLKGNEDLGGGLHAVFTLVNQFAVGTGAIQPPGKGIFGRNAWIGLDSDQYGKLTLGNQYDFMTDALFFGRTDAAMSVGGLYNFRAGPFNKIAIPYNPPYAGQFDWDRMSGQTVTNSVKYSSPSLAGFRFGMLYGFGGVPGSIGSGNTVSAGINYDNGPFGAAAAYTEAKYLSAGAPEVGIRNWGVGAHYQLGSLTTNALITTVRNTQNGGAIAEGEIGVEYLVTPSVQLGADYMYMKGNDFLNNNHAHQVTAVADYFLSKRTLVYVEAVYQRTNSGAQALISGVLDADGTSSGPSQFLTRVGVETRF
nr:porin [Paraburkholderia saeva]